MKYLGHISDGHEQELRDHLLGTAKLAETFASAFGAGDLGGRCGMLHDIGKYSDPFQRRIRGSAERVDHSTAGALEAFLLRDLPAAFCIAGHHSGLPDLGNQRADHSESLTFWGRMKRRTGAEIEDYRAFRKEIEIPQAGPLPFRRSADAAGALSDPLPFRHGPAGKPI